MEDLLAKYFAGEASAEEIKKVEAWRSESREHAKLFLETKALWYSASKPKPPSGELVKQIIGDNKGARRINFIWLKYAAIFIAVFGIAFLIHYFTADTPSEIIATEMLTHELPDGSEVTLQKGSSLKIGDFEKGRAVFLTGRAYFDIEEDKSLPFVINTKSARIQVTGTSFVVNNLTEDATEVFVESGSVALYQNPTAFKGSSMMVNLSEGEMGRLAVDQRGIRKRKVKDQNYLAWKTGVLTFKDTFMAQVAYALEDMYGLQISYENEAIKHCRLTANYKNKTSEEVLSYITQTFDFEFEKTGNKVVLKGDGCR